MARSMMVMARSMVSRSVSCEAGRTCCTKFDPALEWIADQVAHQEGELKSVHRSMVNTQTHVDRALLLTQRERDT